jgi:cytochrome c553
VAPRASACAAAAGLAIALAAGAAAAGDTSPDPGPDWAYARPATPAAELAAVARLTAPATAAADAPEGVPGSAVRLRPSTLGPFRAADWFPADHDPPPPVVAAGVPPDVWACGYCHTPGGQGRPENAALAGLPAAYIEAQVAAFRDGTRSSAIGDDSRPTALMIEVARHASDADVAAAARYFAAQRLAPRVEVREIERLPAVVSTGSVYALDPRGGDAALGGRLVEAAPDLHRHELRDDRMRYLAFVPRGSLDRGSAVVTAGSATVPACTTCHGADLRGSGAAPPLAGRFASYLLRQLYAFRTGARRDPGAATMIPVATGLSSDDLVSVAAYLASLPSGPPR